MGKRLRYKENEFASIWFEDGIVYEIFKANVKLTLDAAKIVVRDRVEVSQGERSPILVDVSKLIGTDSDARKYTSSEEALIHLTAGAFIIPSPTTRMIFNVWMKINKPRIPTKGFSSIHEAERWLEQFLYMN